MVARGYAGIFHFPFRIHAQEQLCGHESQGSDFRYRVDVPFLVRTTGSPITSDVPQEMWPNFKWHEAVPEKMRGEQAAAPDVHYTTPAGTPDVWYDGFRLDFWGSDAPNRLLPFVVSAMRWLRHLSGQPWISDVDVHYMSILKRPFLIDELGAAVEEVGGFTQVRMAAFQFVTNAMWRSAFEHALWHQAPIYSNLFFDAVNAAATDDYARAIMNLAMALESCRDINYSKIHPSAVKEGRGPRLKPPFHRTDLIKHLSVLSAKVFGRDFSADHPEHWDALRNLYVARHCVAHGKSAVFRTNSGLKIVDEKSYAAMQNAAGAALTWMEKLSRDRIPPPPSQ